jgi:putative oxidoreductase
MAAVLLVAIVAVHLPYVLSSIELLSVTPTGPQFGDPGYECDLLYLACIAALVMTGLEPFAMYKLAGAAIHKLRMRKPAPLRMKA